MVIWEWSSIAVTMLYLSLEENVYCEAGEVIGDSGSLTQNSYQEANSLQSMQLPGAEEDEQTLNMTWASAQVCMPKKLEAAEKDEEVIYYEPGALIIDETIEAANLPSSCEVMDKNSISEDDDVFE